MALVQRELTGLNDEILKMKFIDELTKGTLSTQQFANYIAQDNLYLKTYSELFNLASSMCQDVAEADFLKSDIADEVDGEYEFHYKWLSNNGFNPQLFDISKTSITPRKATAEYMKHLENAAQSGSYAVLIAALTPCCYVYQQIATAITQAVVSGHSRESALQVCTMPDDVKEAKMDRGTNPYQVWIDAYADESFVPIVNRLVDIVCREYDLADSKTKQLMVDYYCKAARLELDFFEQV